MVEEWRMVVKMKREEEVGRKSLRAVWKMLNEIILFFLNDYLGGNTLIYT